MEENGAGKNSTIHLCRESTKHEYFWQKNAKVTKLFYAYKVYVSSYYVDILNSFNPELWFKDIESAIRNKLIDLLPELRGFKFYDNIGYRIYKNEKRRCNKIYQLLF